jgi:hypothetical protein
VCPAPRTVWNPTNKTCDCPPGLFGPQCVTCAYPRQWQDASNQCLCPTPKTVWNETIQQC